MRAALGFLGPYLAIPLGSGALDVVATNPLRTHRRKLLGEEEVEVVVLVAMAEHGARGAAEPPREGAAKTLRPGKKVQKWAMKWIIQCVLVALLASGPTTVSPMMTCLRCMIPPPGLAGEAEERQTETTKILKLCSSRACVAQMRPGSHKSSGRASISTYAANICGGIILILLIELEAAMRPSGKGQSFGTAVEAAPCM